MSTAPKPTESEKLQKKLQSFIDLETLNYEVAMMRKTLSEELNRVKTATAILEAQLGKETRASESDTFVSQNLVGSKSPMEHVEILADAVSAPESDGDALGIEMFGSAAAEKVAAMFQSEKHRTVELEDQDLAATAPETQPPTEATLESQLEEVAPISSIAPPIEFPAEEAPVLPIAPPIESPAEEAPVLPIAPPIESPAEEAPVLPIAPPIESQSPEAPLQREEHQNNSPASISEGRILRRQRGAKEKRVSKRLKNKNKGERGPEIPQKAPTPAAKPPVKGVNRGAKKVGRPRGPTPKASKKETEEIDLEIIDFLDEVRNARTIIAKAKSREELSALFLTIDDLQRKILSLTTEGTTEARADTDSSTDQAHAIVQWALTDGSMHDFPCQTFRSGQSFQLHYFLDGAYQLSSKDGKDGGGEYDISHKEVLSGLQRAEAMERSMLEGMIELNRGQRTQVALAGEQTLEEMREELLNRVAWAESVAAKKGYL